MKSGVRFLVFGFILMAFNFCYSQPENPATNNSATPPPKPKWDYQIYLKQPAKEIKELLFEKDCSPAKGQLSDDKKTIILKDYEQGKRVYVKIVYEDGTEEEFTKSSCYIDPLIL